LPGAVGGGDGGFGVGQLVGTGKQSINKWAKAAVITGMRDKMLAIGTLDPIGAAKFYQSVYSGYG
jgi:hypothetical protein